MALVACLLIALFFVVFAMFVVTDLRELSRRELEADRLDRLWGEDVPDATTAVLSGETPSVTPRDSGGGSPRTWVVARSGPFDRETG